MSKFKPNCTIPPENVNFVSGPNTRGTVSIIWNCLSIIFLCTWNILHLNVPARRPRTSSLLKKLWWAILDSRTKVWWMFITILAPEYIMGKALNDWLSARWSFSDFEELARADGTDWELIHGYYANMGGFVLDFSDFFPKEPEIPTVPVEDSLNAIPMKNSSPSEISQDYFVDLVNEALRLSGREGESPQFKLARMDRINLTRMKHWEWKLNIGQLFVARKREIIHLPRISVEDLEAMDKSDNLVKAIAIVQVLWLVVQLIVRKTIGLPTSQIEITALAFSVSSIITYFLYLGHPQGVRSITKIKAQKLPQVNDIINFLVWSPYYLWTGPRIKDRLDGLGDFVSLPNDSCNPPIPDEVPMSSQLWTLTAGNPEVLTLLVGAVLGGTVFGGVHCLAWNFKFPTELESTFWRVASVIIAAMPLLSTPFSLKWLKLNGYWPSGDYDNRRPYVSFILLVFCAFPYVIARLFLIVEIFRSLFYSPPGVFIETWSGSFPHWG